MGRTTRTEAQSSGKEAKSERDWEDADDGVSEVDIDGKVGGVAKSPAARTLLAVCIVRR